MRDRITLKVIARTADDIGGFSRADTMGDELYAYVTPAGAREVWRYQQIDKRVDYTVFLRYRSDIVRGMTILWNGLELYVIGAQETDHRKNYMQLDCVVGAPL
jgi:SPP1 family predicted phage head-tail adaptor